jgi:proteasome lid subunit RPN8/RPN11
MKNIHIIPTDNYSDLVHSTYKYGGYFLSRHYSPMKDMGDSYQNIYITSDEKAEDEDWLLIIDDFETYVHKHKRDNFPNTYCKKIILTTDQDLIKDGVQAIDDEFLEWFVKNPSCEKVEVETTRERNGYHSKHKKRYKIIIPQEEPKPHSFCETPDEKCTMNYCDENGCQNRKRELVEPQEEPKQETLEGNPIHDDIHDKKYSINDFFNMIEEYREKELPHRNVPYHYEAEIDSGLKYLIMFIKEK